MSKKILILAITTIIMLFISCMLILTSHFLVLIDDIKPNTYDIVFFQLIIDLGAFIDITLYLGLTFILMSVILVILIVYDYYQKLNHKLPIFLEEY